MIRLAILSVAAAVGIYGGMLLRPHPPAPTSTGAPQITAAIDHGAPTITPVRWGRFYGGYYGPGFRYYRPYYGYYGPGFGYSAYYGPYGGGYYYGSPYVWWW